MVRIREPGSGERKNQGSRTRGGLDQKTGNGRGKDQGTWKWGGLGLENQATGGGRIRKPGIEEFGSENRKWEEDGSGNQEVRSVRIRDPGNGRGEDQGTRT